ncbi:MAG: hypothetical protein PHI73_02610 [Patescibacteria group bacterium]|nr:hypothetical protein [Patescibacteria group bacterium]
MKKSSGSWKKERTTGRKYSRSDAHQEPKARTRKMIWVSGYTGKGGHVDGYFRTNPNFKRK